MSQPGEKGTIRFDQFLKWMGLVEAGGEAKIRIQGGEVTVNGVVETRRSKKLHSGDRVGLDGIDYLVAIDPEEH